MCTVDATSGSFSRRAILTGTREQLALSVEIRSTNTRAASSVSYCVSATASCSWARALLLWAPFCRELAEHVVELGDERRKVCLVHDPVQLEVEMDLPEIPAAALRASVTHESYVAERVELYGQGEP